MGTTPRFYHSYLVVVRYLVYFVLPLSTLYSDKVLGFFLISSLQAWTVIQVFTEQYAVTESFQLPLFQGPPPAEIIDQLNSQPCQKCIKENILKDKVRFFFLWNVGVLHSHLIVQISLKKKKNIWCSPPAPAYQLLRCNTI